jgi:hypothetical protein
MCAYLQGILVSRTRLTRCDGDGDGDVAPVLWATNPAAPPNQHWEACNQGALKGFLNVLRKLVAKQRQHIATPDALDIDLCQLVARRVILPDALFDPALLDPFTSVFVEGGINPQILTHPRVRICIPNLLSFIGRSLQYARGQHSHNLFFLNHKQCFSTGGRSFPLES